MVLLTPQTALRDNKITMLRVLMVLEDYGELMFLQTVLKKIGFDVDAIQNPRSFQDSLLRMNPDILIMTAFGKRVKGLELAKATKKVRDLPKILLLATSEQGREEDIAVNAWLESPLGAVMMLDTIADLCGLSKQVLQEKFHKLKLTEIEQERARVLHVADDGGPSLERSETTRNFGVMQGSTLSSEDRKSRYAKFLTEPAPDKHGFAVKQVQEQVKALRREESSSNTEDLERERKAFVEHLFKKKAE